VLAVIVTIQRGSMCSANSYCTDLRIIVTITVNTTLDLPVIVIIVTITANTAYRLPRYVLAVILTIMTITGGFICGANSHCDNNDNNWDVYM
jgi:hypothetical protein